MIGKVNTAGIQLVSYQKWRSADLLEIHHTPMMMMNAMIMIMTVMIHVVTSAAVRGLVFP